MFRSPNPGLDPATGVINGLLVAAPFWLLLLAAWCFL